MPHAASPPFGPARTGVREARRWASDVAAGWGLARERDTLMLVVSELATNAMLHAGSTAKVSLEYDPAAGALDVTVDDHHQFISTHHACCSLRTEAAPQRLRGRVM